MEHSSDRIKAAPGTAAAGEWQGHPRGAPAECQRKGYLIYRDVFGGWRWEYRQADGHYIDSRSSYSSREECAAAAERSAADRMHVHGG